MNRKTILVLSGILFFAAVRAYAARFTMNPDGISYIEMGQAYIRGDFHMALSAWWSPLYAVIIALPISIFSIPIYWEFVLVHAINFCIFIFALYCFYLLVTEINIRATYRKDSLPEQIFELLAYSIFFVSSLNVISLTLITPDLLVSGFLYASVAYLLRIERDPKKLESFVFLGVALGFGYLTKTPIFPLSIVFFALAYIVSRSMSRVALTVFLFFVISAFFFVPLSLSKGRVTVGDSGHVNYAWYVNGAKHHIHWQGSDGLGEPVHTTRKIFSNPSVFEFEKPIGGSYPPWYDPSYWFEGIKPHFDIRNQVSNIFINTGHYFDTLKRYYGIFVLLLITIIFLVCDRIKFIKNIIRNEWAILLVALSGLCMFGVVLVQNRYVAPFIVLLWVGVFAGMQFKDKIQMRYINYLILGGSTIVFTIVAYVAVKDFYTHRNDPYTQWQVAEGLSLAGVQQGDSVAYIGNEFSGLTAYWAHLAGVRIISEMPSSQDNQKYWHGDKQFQQDVVGVFRGTGVKAIIAEPAPYYSSMPGWQKIGTTDYFIYRF